MFGRFSSGPLIKEIGQVTSGRIGEEEVVSIRTASVVCANYRAIVHDFPQVFSAEALRAKPLIGCDACAASRRLCPRAINDWLIRNAAFVSRPQLLPNAVNSPIEVGDVVRTAYRPRAYGRAVVVPIDAPESAAGARFLDLKGAGVAAGKIPTHEKHSTGLEYLGYVIADFFYGWLIDTIFARTFPGYHIVPVYAVLDLGFDIVNGWHGTAPAGLHVRRAHSRPVPDDWIPLSGSDRERLMLHVELLLRKFGLSTTGAANAFRLANAIDGDELVYLGEAVRVTTDLERQKATKVAQLIRDHSGEPGGDNCLEITNVQLASDASWSNKTLQVFDFGHIRAERDFVNPVANMVRNAALRVGRIISPRDASFVRPSNDLRVDPELCNRRSINALGFYAAQAFRSASKRAYLGGHLFDQRAVETMLRIARLKALGRNYDWAVQSVAARRLAPTSNFCPSSVWSSLDTAERAAIGGIQT